MFLPSGYHRKFKISNFSVYKAIDETTAVAQTSMTAELGGRDAAAGGGNSRHLTTYNPSRIV